MCILFALSCLCVCGGAVCSRLTGFSFCLFGPGDGGFLWIWLGWLWPAVAYLLAVVGSAFFLLGPALIVLLQGAACFVLGVSGATATQLYGWRGLVAHAGLSLTHSLVLMLYCSFAGKSMSLSSMMRSKLFGAQRGLLYPVETRRFLLRAALMLGVTAIWTAAAAASGLLVL